MEWAGSSSDAVACLGSRTWVLVVHNFFRDILDYERIGNEADLTNLKRVFCDQRKCKFAELENCDAGGIVKSLSQEDKLIALFHPNDDCKFWI